MDFDDLDDELEKRLEDGEEVAGFQKINNQPRQGDLLPLMKRSNGMPPMSRLPEKQRKEIPPWNGQEIVEKKPILRLLIAHGVCDSINQGWHLLAADAPPEIEVATHEFPGHGHREEEEILGDMEKLSDDCFDAWKDAMDTGSFALLGHSIGCLIITRVAMRARKELGVEPVVVFMVERGACPYPKWTEEGMRVLREDRVEFMRLMQPAAASLYSTGTEMGLRTMNMWQRGWFMENATMEVGTHVFKCQIIAIYAELMVDSYIDDAAIIASNLTKNEDVRKTSAWNALHTREADGRTFTGHFPLRTFEEWDKWSEHPTLVIKNIKNSDHMSIKTDPAFRKCVWEHLREVLKTW